MKMKRVVTVNNKFLITGCSADNNLGSMIADLIMDLNPVAEIVGINNHGCRPTDKVAGSLVSTYYANLADIGQIEGVCDSIKNRHEHFDVFVHAAGLSNLTWFEDINYKQFMDVINVNAISPVVIVKELGQLLHKGTCCFISSNASHSPMRCSLAYNMSKAALTMASKQMARELTRQREMTIFTISPNKLRGTGMSEIVDAIVPELRGWTASESNEIQCSAMVNGKQTDPKQFVDFLVKLLLEKKNHEMLSGCDIPYGA